MIAGHPVPRCLLCGSPGTVQYDGLADRLFGAAGTWALRHCRQCRLLWLDPRPRPEHTAELYRDYYTRIPSETAHGLRRIVRDSILSASFGYRALPAPRWLGRALGAIPPLREMAGLTVMMLEHGARGRVLDVGCGNGQFLASMRSLGWRAVGIDTDTVGVRVTRDRFGIPVVLAPLENAGFADACFDAVTMHHVIEHVPDPVATLRECRRVVRPGGRVVVVTPNVESLGHRHFQESWLGLDVPRHFHVFSKRALGLIAEAAGLRILALRTTARNARFVWVASSTLRRQGTLPGAYPACPSWSTVVTGLGFQLLEHAIHPLPSMGEELWMMTVRDGP